MSIADFISRAKNKFREEQNDRNVRRAEGLAELKTERTRLKGIEKIRSEEAKLKSDIKELKSKKRKGKYSGIKKGLKDFQDFNKGRESRVNASPMMREDKKKKKGGPMFEY